MAALCPRCGREFDATLFQFGRPVTCPCGNTLYEPGHTIYVAGGGVRALLPAGTSEPERQASRQAMEELAREADRVAVKIKDPSWSRVDVIVAVSLLKSRCLELFPDQEELFGMIYESRFERLWEQFRGGSLYDREAHP